MLPREKQRRTEARFPHWTGNHEILSFEVLWSQMGINAFPRANERQYTALFKEKTDALGRGTGDDELLSSGLSQFVRSCRWFNSACRRTIVGMR